MALEKFNNGEQNSSVRTKINAAIDKVNGLSEGVVGAVGSIKLDSVAGSYYGDPTELTGNITIEDATSILGGTAYVYHKSGTAPTITTAMTKQVIPINGAYVPNASNLIAISKIGANKIGIVYKQLSEVAVDTTDPTVPTSLTSSSTTETATTLSWTAATDNVGVTGYVIYKNGVYEKEVAGTTTNITGLVSGTTYSFTVAAIDAAGNESAQSTAHSVTTVASSDTTAPTVPTNLTSPSKTDTTVDLSWTASTDAVGVTGYKIYVDGVFNKEVAALTGQVTGLIASTAYNFTVSAMDAAGNESAQTAALVVTTETGVPVGLTPVMDFNFNETTGGALNSVDGTYHTVGESVTRDGEKYTFINGSSTSFVQIGDKDEFSFIDADGDVPFEIEFIDIIFKDKTNTQFVFNKRGGSSSTYEYQCLIAPTTGNFSISLYSDGNTASVISASISGSDLSLDTPYNIKIKYDGLGFNTGISFEINGVPYTTPNYGGTAPENYVGMDNTSEAVIVGSAEFGGSITSNSFAGSIGGLKVKKG